jgi:hypothetical protein
MTICLLTRIWFLIKAQTLIEVERLSNDMAQIQAQVTE